MGGKSKIADHVWRRFGKPKNFIDPFCFSNPILLRRPGGPGPIETINDVNGFVANFWRAVQRDPEGVAVHADWPVNEVDLHARHWWMVTSAEARHKLDQVSKDPDAFDVRIAGWWAWGACCWIGSGWCDTPEWSGRANAAAKPRGLQCGPDGPTGNKRPRIHGGAGSDPPGVHSGMAEMVSGAKRPLFVVNNTARPQLANAFARGSGVNANDHASTCTTRREWLTGWTLQLADRMRPVRVCCGDWKRVCDSDSTMTRLGLTAVFLDPPYRKHIDGKKNRTAAIYANDKTQDVNALCDEVQDYCLNWGSKPDVRIALCGLEGEYPAIEAAGWSVYAWKSSGYGNRSDAGQANAARERVWFSPACLPEDDQMQLFDPQ